MSPTLTVTLTTEERDQLVNLVAVAIKHPSVDIARTVAAAALMRKLGAARQGTAAAPTPHEPHVPMTDHAD